MSVDKLVDSTQLDADLASVANAIRTKGGTSAQLAFPSDFVSAINAIQTGGGGGLNYILTTANCASTSGSLSVACDYTNFIFVAEAATPKLISTNNRCSFFMFIIVNDGVIATLNSGGSAYVVRTSSSKWAAVTNSAHYSHSNGVVTATPYSSSTMVTGTWNVLIVELPSNHPFIKLTV